MTRRTPAPKADRERARRAAEYADEMLENTWSAAATSARYERHGGYHTHAYAYAFIEDIRVAMEAAEVAADAFEETRQVRPLEKYRKRADDLRKTLSMHEYYAAYKPYDTNPPRRDPPARRRPSDRPRSAEGNENLAYLLDRDVRAIGPERAAAPPARDIRLLISPSGSYRYVGLENGRPVSALQIISHDGGIRGVIANVYTTPFARRRGWAARLLEVARRRFREVKHSDDLSPAGEAWKRTVRDPDESEKLSFRFMAHGADSRAVRLHKDASGANRTLNTELYEKGYYEDVPLKDRKRWLLRVASLAHETSDLWAVTADAYEEEGDLDAAELASFKSRALDRVAREYQHAAQSLTSSRDARLESVNRTWKRTARDPGDEEEVESWPLIEPYKKDRLAAMHHHIEEAENSEVLADLEEARGDLRESRARSREAGASYYAASDRAAVSMVQTRADLRRLDQRIELLERAWRSFRRGRAFHAAEQVRRRIDNLTSQARERSLLIR